MHKIGRNDRCPCGSGKKYKACCLNRDEAAARLFRSRDRALEEALDWVREVQPDFIADAVSELLGDIDLGELEQAGGPQRVRGHLLDFVLGDAIVLCDGVPTTAAELLDRSDCPLDNDPTVAFVRALTRAPLRLWNVARVADDGVFLVDLLDSRELLLEDERLRLTLEADDVIALRIAEIDGTPQTFWHPWFLDESAIDEIRAAQTAHSAEHPFRVGHAIASAWLGMFTESPDDDDIDGFDPFSEGLTIWEEFEITDRKGLFAELDATDPQELGDGTPPIRFALGDGGSSVAVVGPTLLVMSSDEAHSAAAQAEILKDYGKFLTPSGRVVPFEPTAQEENTQE